MRGLPKSRAVILIVDDDPRIREIVRFILDDTYQVLDACDGDAALSLLQSCRVDLVLLDLVMAGTDGIRVLEKMRARKNRVPVIVVSGLTNAWAATTAMKLGATDYIVKPFDEQELLLLVDAALGRSASTVSETEPRPARILLVGCPLGVAASFGAALSEHAGVESVPANHDLLTRLPSVSPDVVVVDLDGHVADPDALLTQVEARFLLASVVALNGPRRRATQTLGWEARGITVLPRPVTMRDLVESVRAELSPGVVPLPRLSLRVVTIMEYVADNLAVVTLRRLGDALRTSPYYLSRLYRAETGLSIKNYINRARVAAARLLMLETPEKLESIATRVGFHDGAHLSRFFLKCMGHRPGDYRRRWREDPGHAPTISARRGCNGHTA